MLKIVKNTYKTEREMILGEKYLLSSNMFGKDVLAKIRLKSLWGYLIYTMKH